MSDPRAQEALSRIEQAVARLETVLSKAGNRPGNEPEEFRRLQAAHEALRSRVAGAIGQIDRIIESGERR